MAGEKEEERYEERRKRVKIDHERDERGDQVKSKD